MRAGTEGRAMFLTIEGFVFVAVVVGVTFGGLAAHTLLDVIRR